WQLAGRFVAACNSSWTPLSAARSAINSCISSRLARRSTGIDSIFNIPASIFERSRMSLMMPSSRLPDQLFQMVAIALDLVVLALVVGQGLPQLGLHGLGLGDVGNEAIPDDAVVAAAFRDGIDQQPLEAAIRVIDPVLDAP